MKKPSTANLALDARHYDFEIIKMMDETKHCLNCGASLEHQLDKQKRRNRGYCNLSCYVKKPPKLAYAEKAWDKPARELILELLNGHTVEATAGLLGVGRQQVYEYMSKFNIRKKVMFY